MVPIYLQVIINFYFFLISVSIATALGPIEASSFMVVINLITINSRVSNAISATMNVLGGSSLGEKNRREF